MWLKKHFALPALVLCAAQLASADTIQLKDKAAVTGKILADKPDAVVVDVGYTVLVVPRNVIAGISKVDEATPQIEPVASNAIVNVNTPPQFYTVASRPGTPRDVSSL